MTGKPHDGGGMPVWSVRVTYRRGVLVGGVTKVAIWIWDGASSRFGERNYKGILMA